MNGLSILYMDPVFDGFKQVMHSLVPSGHKLYFWHELNDNERKTRLQEADVLLVAVQSIDQELILNAKNLKLIQKTGIGVDNIDLKTAASIGIPVANTPGGNASGVAELTVLFILALYRKLLILNEATKKGEWLMWELRPESYEMFGKVHGLIGFGSIAKEVAKRSQAFGTRIVYYDKFRLNEEAEKHLNVQFMPFEELLEQANIVSLHVPLTSETKRLMGASQFARMKPTSVLINVARGYVVDEHALYHALLNGQIAGAGIDCWESEPIDPSNPLLTLPNVLATPHIGAGTLDTLQRVLTIAFDNISRIAVNETPEFVLNQELIKG